VLLERADRRTSQNKGMHGHAKAKFIPAPFKKKQRY
jgi:hypothetical protein